MWEVYTVLAILCQFAFVASIVICLMLALSGESVFRGSQYSQFGFYLAAVQVPLFANLVHEHPSAFIVAMLCGYSGIAIGCLWYWRRGVRKERLNRSNLPRAKIV